MRHTIFLCLISIFCLNHLQAQVSKSNKQKEQKAQVSSVMSEAYWKLWSPEVQAKIAKDIDQNRKSNAVL